MRYPPCSDESNLIKVFYKRFVAKFTHMRTSCYHTEYYRLFVRYGQLASEANSPVPDNYSLRYSSGTGQMDPPINNLNFSFLQVTLASLGKEYNNNCMNRKDRER